MQLQKNPAGNALTVVAATEVAEEVEVVSEAALHLEEAVDCFSV